MIKIIAEVGINHNGDMGICRDLIDVAKSSGCDVVKFQKRDLELVYSQNFLDEKRESPWGNTQRDQKNGLEFGYEEYMEIDEYCKDVGIEWFASAWDHKSQEFLRQFDCPYNKIASAMLIDKNHLAMVAEGNIHTYISTGMSTFSDIDYAVEVFTKVGTSFELMHCVSTYPMLDEDANLKMIEVLRQRYGCDVGYSGHESGLAVSIAAVALGITSLERHITLDRAMYGSDQSASLSPAGLGRLVGSVRKVEKAMGDGDKRILPAEKAIAKKLRGHIAFDYNEI